MRALGGRLRRGSTCLYRVRRDGRVTSCLAVTSKGRPKSASRFCSCSPSSRDRDRSIECLRTEADKRGTVDVEGRQACSRVQPAQSREGGRVGVDVSLREGYLSLLHVPASSRTDAAPGCRIHRHGDLASGQVARGALNRGTATRPILVFRDARLSFSVRPRFELGLLRAEPLFLARALGLLERKRSNSRARGIARRNNPVRGQALRFVSDGGRVGDRRHQGLGRGCRHRSFPDALHRQRDAESSCDHRDCHKSATDEGRDEHSRPGTRRNYANGCFTATNDAGTVCTDGQSVRLAPCTHSVVSISGARHWLSVGRHRRLWPDCLRA
jgi:hypothetical protein